METNTGTVLGTWNQANTPVCSLHRLTVESNQECTDCKGTGVGQVFFFFFSIKRQLRKGHCRELLLSTKNISFLCTTTSRVNLKDLKHL